MPTTESPRWMVYLVCFITSPAVPLSAQLPTSVSRTF